MDVLTNVFWHEGSLLANHDTINSKLTGYRKFRTFFGISPEVCAILWEKMHNKPPGSEPKHFLWCLFYLKNYNKEHVNATVAHVDEKTFRSWTWRYVKLLAELSVVG